MLLNRLPRESAEGLDWLNSGSIWPGIKTVSERPRPPARTALKGLANEEISIDGWIPLARVGGTS
jgi:hypothetical protein